MQLLFKNNHRYSIDPENDKLNKKSVFESQSRMIARLCPECWIIAYQSLSENDLLLVCYCFIGFIRAIVSGDSDLLNIKKFKGIEILTPKQFVDL